MIYFFDTSAILNGALKEYPERHIYISTTVLSELENIKHLNKAEKTKMLARETVRDLLSSTKYYYFISPMKKIDKILEKISYLDDINDHRIIIEAKLLQKEFQEKVTFITSDGTQYLLAREYLGDFNVDFFIPYSSANVNYKGWKKFYPSDDEFNYLYSHQNDNFFNLKTNEYAALYKENNKLCDILFWNGESYENLKYENIKNKFLGDTIKPLNLEQKMAFHLLQNKNITVKLLQGVAGSGKDLLMIYHALDLIQRGEKDKIIFIRNLVPFKDAPEIGFIKGDLQEKIEWGLGPLQSILGEEALQLYRENGTIEAVNLGFIRGCSWQNSIIYVSEGQNITGGGYKLLVSRCGAGSELWVNGDILQTDDRKFDKNNGIQRLINSLAGNELFGMVELIKTERSATANLASKII